MLCDIYYPYNIMEVLIAQMDKTLNQENHEDDVTVTRNHVFSDNIRISECGRFVDVMDRSDVALLTNLIQYTKQPLNPDHRLFRMIVKNMPDKDSFIMFGLNTRCFIGSQVWTVNNSLRYHSNDGGVFNGGPGQRTDSLYGKGDEVVCYLDHMTSQRSLCMFMVNGKLVYRQWVKLPSDIMYPTIGFKGCPISLEVTWPGTRPSNEIIDIKQEDFSNWIGFKNITYDVMEQTMSLAEYDDQTREAYSKSAPWPFDDSFSYFEMTLETTMDTDCMPAIGLRGATPEKYRMPGWDLDTIGYHGDIGAIFYGSGETSAYNHDDMICVAGDRQGCGVIFPCQVNNKSPRCEADVLVYFTRNDQVVYHKTVMAPEGGLYPTIGFCRKGEIVKINMHANPPALTPDIVNSLVTSGPSPDRYRHHPAMLYKEVVNNSDLAQPCCTKIELRDKESKMLTFQCIQTELNEKNHYFSAKIINSGCDDSTCMMGLATSSFPLENAGLGKDKISCGIESKAGVVVTNGITSQVGTFGVDDEIGIHLEHMASGKADAIVLFTKNKRSLGRACVLLPGSNTRDHYDIDDDEYNAGRRLLATVVLQKGPMAVEVTWPGKNMEQPKLTMENLTQWVMTKDVFTQESSDGSTQSNVISCRPCGNAEQEDPYWQITQSCLPVSEDGVTYMEVTFLRCDSKHIPGIGLTKHQPPRNQPIGHDSDGYSVAFYGNTGEIWYDANMVVNAEEQKCTFGDRIGVGVLYKDTCDPTGRSEQKVMTYFTRNGVVVNNVMVTQPRGGLYLTLSFCPAEVSVCIDFPSCPNIPEAELRQWTDELDGMRMTGEDDRRMYQQLVSDVVNYTDYIIPKSNEQFSSNSSAAAANQNIHSDNLIYGSKEENRKTVYISHVASDKDKACQLLDCLSKEGHVIEMSLWLTADAKVLQETVCHVDYIIVCLSKQYCHDPQIVKELDTLLKQGAPIIPVSVAYQTKWPPGGLLEVYSETFAMYAKYLLDFSKGHVDGSQLVYMITCAENKQDPNTTSKKKSKTCLLI